MMRARPPASGTNSGSKNTDTVWTSVAMIV